jgi:AraC family transcriptional regulator
MQQQRTPATFGSWATQLDHPPRVERMAVGLHGCVPTERFRVTGLWSVHLYRYDGDLHIIDTGDTFPIHPGYAGITPPDLDVEYRFPDHALHLYAHLALDPPPTQPSAKAEQEPGATTDVPAMVDLGDTFTAWWTSWSRILRVWRQQPAAASAFAWHLIWTLTSITNQAQTPLNPSRTHHEHPAVHRALHIIETRLSQPLRVTAIAQEVGLSHNQLTRLFRNSTGLTPLAYIRERRVDQAVHLLTRSTRPIKSIAIEVGIPDLQAFNKTIRAATGRPPRAHRETAP